jgi:hypothetical protein
VVWIYVVRLVYDVVLDEVVIYCTLGTVFGGAIIITTITAAIAIIVGKTFP